jgi:glycolate oxidase FAD binding subunit
LRNGREPIAALEVAFLDGVWRLAIRIEGRDETVAAVAGRIGAMAGGDVTRVDGSESASWWASYVAQQLVAASEDAILVRCGVRPKETEILATGMSAAFSELGVSAPYLAASPGLGVVVARLDFGSGSEGSAGSLAELQGILLGLAETATILSAPPSWKQGIDVWGRLPEGFDVMRSLREQFDPKRTINPGRFAGFL